MKTPCCSAAARTSWPFGAAISRPLTVSVISPSGTRGLRRLVGESVHRHGHFARSADVRLELMPEPADRGRDGRHGRGAQRTDRRLAGRPVDARTDVVADVEEHVDVFGSSLTVDDAREDLLEPARAFATWRALAARLLGEEAHDAVTGLHDVGVFVHDDDRTRTQHRARLVDGRLLEREVEV